MHTDQRVTTAEYVVTPHEDENIAWSAAEDSTIAHGSDAATVIQTAIDRATGDGGGRVHVTSGEYRIDNSIQPKDAVALSGSGPGKTVLVGTPELEGNGEKPFAIMHSESPLRDVAIEGFEFDGSEMYAPTDPEAYDPHRKAIHSWYATRLVIRNNYVHDTPATGIGNDFNVQCHVVGNVVEGCGTVGEFETVPEDIPGSNGIGVGIGDADRPANPTVIANNIVSGSANNNVLLEGFRGGLTENFVISNNLVYDGRHTGIRIDEARNVVVSSNTVLDNALHGVLITEVEFSNEGLTARDVLSADELDARSDELSGITVVDEEDRIEAGTANGDYQVGEAARNVVLADNLVANNGGTGIEVPYPNSRDLSITGNLVRANVGHGIRLRSVGPHTVVGNTVTGNGNHGVCVQPIIPTATVNVGSNTIADNGASGVDVDASDDSLGGLSVVGNQIHSTEGTQDHGIVLRGDVSEALVATNAVTGDHDEPIRNDAAGADVLVELNLD